MTMPADVPRCQGIAPDSLPCPVRHECERYISLMDPVTTKRLALEYAGVARAADRVPVSRILCVSEDGRPDDTFPHFIAAEK